jgi:hypothetical protein
MGKASVFKMPSEEHVVKFKNFSVDNGPLLEVYLSSAVNPTDSKSVSSAAFVNLGGFAKNQW